MSVNIFRSGMDAFDRSYARTDDMYKAAARRKAGGALASGDQQGAMDAFGAEGLTDDVRQVQQDGQRQEQQQYQRGRQEKVDGQADGDRKGEVLMRVAQGLKSVPAGERRKALASLYPLFQAQQVDTSIFDQLTEEQLTDDQLDAFTGEVEKQIGVNLGGGGYGSFNPRTGDFKTLREPTEKAPQGFRYNEAGELEVDPGFVRGKAQIAGATRAPPRARARARAGGGGGAGGARPGPVVDVDPSQVKWK